MSTPQPQPPLRHAPIQRRSAERLGRILDACAELLDETGYDDLSTRAVAERAGVPIGSVYRFFDNKRAMAEALAHRNLDEYAARITERLTPPGAPGADGDWRPMMDVVVDEYLAMKRCAPGFGFVEFGSPVPVGGVPEGPNHLVADRLRTLLAERLGLDDSGERGERLRVAALLAVEAADALLRLAFRSCPDGDPVIIAETKELLRAYLARVLE
ncbi:TetR/AcrR family transcriptional regulator [Streptomyces sp. SAJ15]|uniref:TetR/AcrR family transcriptional regulator n=1 Tax=Streptomyces sp. SAJ15 TaxID=2011095 RepID=UPI001184E206|nr:TetR/AcrR family transcriptional regulator [Streptomyces sp. SAJ15]TVL90580.1 TetR family transcriptional regulator [Streptomyces sp. SAJ15]